LRLPHESRKGLKIVNGRGMSSTKVSQRSQVMRTIKSENSGIEVAIRSRLHRIGLRFRIHSPRLPGKPDIVFLKARLAVFVDSCFWHGCPKHARMPKTNRAYWTTKIKRNRNRDLQVNEDYVRIGWTVLRLWEHDIKDNLDNCAQKVQRVFISLSSGSENSNRHIP
jgi:DNA mismatch endonuclease (patch repair protein)